METIYPAFYKYYISLITITANIITLIFDTMLKFQKQHWILRFLLFHTLR